MLLLLRARGRWRAIVVNRGSLPEHCRQRQVLILIHVIPQIVIMLQRAIICAKWQIFFWRSVKPILHSQAVEAVTSGNWVWCALLLKMACALCRQSGAGGRVCCWQELGGLDGM